MPQKKHKPEEIVAKLRQVDVLLSQGHPVAEAIRAISVMAFTYSAGVWASSPASGRSSRSKRRTMSPGATPRLLPSNLSMLLNPKLAEPGGGVLENSGEAVHRPAKSFGRAAF